MSWYYAWGGSTDTSGGWAWRIGSSFAHTGYQNGAIADGSTNSWAGRYATPPPGKSTFYGMYYDQQPVHHDPPSNQWFG